MTIQVLVATMNQTDYSLLDKMNIQTDVIVGNQCDRNEISDFEYNGYKVKWLSFNERGVGLNRNNTLMRATADICVLADDDMYFLTGYKEKTEKIFLKYSKADIIVFNLVEVIPTRYVNRKVKRINKFNYGKYGASRIAFRRERVCLNGISFNLLFGGGAKYSAGEDTLFLSECLKKGLKIIAVPMAIAELKDERESTWFKGYTDKFFFDKGVLYYSLDCKKAKLLSFYHCFKHRKRYKEYGWKKAYKTMCQGIKSIK